MPKNLVGIRPAEHESGGAAVAERGEARRDFCETGGGEFWGSLNRRSFAERFKLRGGVLGWNGRKGLVVWSEADRRECVAENGKCFVGASGGRLEVLIFAASRKYIYASPWAGVVILRLPVYQGPQFQTEVALGR